MSLRTALAEGGDETKDGDSDPRPTQPLDPSPGFGNKVRFEYAPSEQVDLEQAGRHSLDRELQGFLSDINERMGRLWPTEFPHIPVGAYRSMVRLCILERVAWDLSPKEMCERVFHPEWYVAKLLRSTEMDEVRRAFHREWISVATPKSLEEHIRDPLVQDRVARRTLRLALHSGDPRVSEGALKQINERAMPVVNKPSETRVLMVTAEVAALITETMKLQQGAIDVKALPVETVDG